MAEIIFLLTGFDVDPFVCCRTEQFGGFFGILVVIRSHVGNDP